MINRKSILKDISDYFFDCLLNILKENKPKYLKA